MENWTEKEKLIWLAGFFDGEGSITISHGSSDSGFVGQICFANVNPILLATVRGIVAGLGISVQDIHWYTSSNSVRLLGVNGRRTIEAILPYLQHPKQLARAVVYLEAFAGRKGEARPKERQKAYVKWLELKIKELQEV